MAGAYSRESRMNQLKEGNANYGCSFGLLVPPLYVTVLTAGY